jgi:hypothetical protein
MVRSAAQFCLVPIDDIIARLVMFTGVASEGLTPLVAVSAAVLAVTACGAPWN